MPKDSAKGRRPLSLRMLWHSLSERVIVGLIILCGISAIIFVFGIFFFICREGYQFFFTKEFDFRGFFLGQVWDPTSPGAPRFGILPMILGTASVTVLAMAFAVPFGLGTAVFISEVCGKKTREALKIMIEMLAAIPSIVWGIVAVMVINPILIYTTGSPVGVNALNGGLVVGLMSVPVIVSIAEDAIRAVPDTYREAAEALGATRWQVIYRVIFPAGKNGLLAAVLLGVGRAVGETMAVLMATGNGINNIPFDGTWPYFHPLMAVTTLTTTITNELGEASEGSPHYESLFVIGMVLFAIAFVVNLTADVLIKGIRNKK